MTIDRVELQKTTGYESFSTSVQIFSLLNKLKLRASAPLARD